MNEYVIDGNMIYRSGEPIAAVLADGKLYFADPEHERYRTPAIKALKEAGRYGETGAVFLNPPPDGDKEEEFDETENGGDNPPSDPPPSDPPNDPLKSDPDEIPLPTRTGKKIRTVRELVTAMAPAIDEPPPVFSSTWGDETPEVWNWIRRHGDVYNTIAAEFEIVIQRNHMEA